MQMIVRKGSAIRLARLSNLRTSGPRVDAVSLGAAAAVGLLSALAHAASWSSSLTGAAPGFDPRR